MKNNIFISLFLILFSQSLKAENVLIESKKITLEKNAELSIFEENVVITTSENNIIKAEYAEYDKKNGVITLKNNVVATDNRNNKYLGMVDKPGQLYRNVNSRTTMITYTHNEDGTLKKTVKPCIAIQKRQQAKEFYYCFYPQDGPGGW